MKNFQQASQGTIVVKVGTNTLVENGVLKEDVMQQIATEILEIRRSGFRVILVTSGAVALGRSLLFHASNSMKNSKQALSALGMSMTVNLWQKCFGNQVLCAMGLVQDHDFEGQDGIKNIKRTFKEFQDIETLEQKYVIPIINGNDFVSHGPIDTDNDRNAASIAKIVRAHSLHLLTNEGGIYDGEPSNIFREIRIGVDNLNMSHVFTEGSIDGTGDMGSKYEEALGVARCHIPVYIGKGSEKGVICKMQRRECGTRIRRTSLAGL